MIAQKREILLFIPTYNESENVEIIYKLIRYLPTADKFDLLFVDDSSPDGTGEILEEIKNKEANMEVVHRDAKNGIGSAHKFGIRWAYEHGYKTLVTMDCDLTHAPEDIGKFLEHRETHHIVIGSRFLQEGSLSTWNATRKVLTRLGHFLTRVLLGVPYDASGAFRLYRLDKIDPVIFSKVESNSYSFFFESLMLLHLNERLIQEVPIHLPKRTYGNSKMSMKDILVSIQFLVKMYLKKTFKKKSLLLP